MRGRAMRSAYFVVHKVLGTEQAAIWWDALPRHPIPNLVYVLRLDQQPNAEKLCTAPLAQLYRTFQTMRERGKLPPRWQPPPPPKKAETVIGFGHRESQAETVERTRARLT